LKQFDASRLPIQVPGNQTVSPELLKALRWSSVRKRMVEVQDLRTSITDQQREEFGQLRMFWKMGGIVHAGIQGAKKLCG
jgi:hypothetical protein